MPMSIAEDPQVFAAQADQATVYKDSTRQEVGNDLADWRIKCAMSMGVFLPRLTSF